MLSIEQRKPRSRRVSDVATEIDEPQVDSAEREDGGRISYTASLITQGKHRFFTLSMPSDVLAETCIVEPRNEEPLAGFQRALDERRAREIAHYIDSGFGTIPSSIVLSAQKDAELLYRRKPRTLSFAKTPRSFLILDGQHRVFGFKLATSRLRVPVVIYNNLNRTEECRLFIDINTKQRPVPNELLLDIKKLADTESGGEALLRDVFDAFDKEPSSPLLGLMSPSERKKGKISRVTFNAALKPITDSFADAEPSYVYDVLSSYLRACLSGLRTFDLQHMITNSTIFRALMLQFPAVAERVADRYANDFSVENFNEIVAPMFSRLKRSDLEKPGTSHIALQEILQKAFRSGFTIGKGPAN
jgi:DGQHR domain-containing protein